MAVLDIQSMAADVVETLRPFAEEIERVARTRGAASGRLSARSAVLYDALVVEEGPLFEVADVLMQVSRDDLEDLLDALLEHGHALDGLWESDKRLWAGAVARLAALVARIAAGAARCMDSGTQHGARLWAMSERCATAARQLSALSAVGPG